MPETLDLSRHIRGFGPHFNPEVLAATRALFRPLVEQTDWSRREAVTDIAYGVANRQKLDLFPADQPCAPILLFVHGGGFVGGDKDGDGVFYGNVGRFFADHGYLGICMNYRLAPESTWPAGSEDLALALDWITANAAQYGGDPDRIVLVGQSAGAAHVASVVFDNRFALPGGVRAAALLSGFYEAKEGMLPGPRLYFGEEPTNWRDRSVTTHMTAEHIPLLLSVTEFDPAQIAEQTLSLAQALNVVDGSPPRFAWLEGQNHVSAVHGLGIGDDAAGRMLLSFFAETLR